MSGVGHTADTEREVTVIREALLPTSEEVQGILRPNHPDIPNWPRREAALAALDALAARVVQAETDRDAAWEAAKHAVKDGWNLGRERAVSAERRLAALEDALRECARIAALDNDTPERDLRHIGEIARDALAAGVESLAVGPEEPA